MERFCPFGGGALFHLIIESKLQYVFEYLPLIWPLAAYGLIRLWPTKRRENRPELPEKDQAKEADRGA